MQSICLLLDINFCSQSMKLPNDDDNNIVYTVRIKQVVEPLAIKSIF